MILDSPGEMTYFAIISKNMGEQEIKEFFSKVDALRAGPMENVVNHANAWLMDAADFVSKYNLRLSDDLYSRLGGAVRISEEVFNTIQSGNHKRETLEKQICIYGKAIMDFADIWMDERPGEARIRVPDLNLYGFSLLHYHKFIKNVNPKNIFSKFVEEAKDIVEKLI